MSSNKLNLHTDAVNLARRYSVQNENDFMQEDFLEASEKEPTKKFDHATCEELSHHTLHLKNLPDECKKFQDVVAYLKRHDTDRTHGTQILI